MLFLNFIVTSPQTAETRAQSAKNDSATTGWPEAESRATRNLDQRGEGVTQMLEQYFIPIEVYKAINYSAAESYADAVMIAEAVGIDPCDARAIGKAAATAYRAELIQQLINHSK